MINIFGYVPVNVFGATGFIGSRFVELYNGCVINHRTDYTPQGKNILYLISTTDNYNIHTNLHLDIDTNLTVLMRVLESIPKYQLSYYTFNFISSWFVYGEEPDRDPCAKETDYCNPKGFYSITKRAAEQLLISFCETYGMSYRILRLANVIGPGDKHASSRKNALTYLLQRLKNNEEISLYDNGDFYRDFIYIDDCVRAIQLVLLKGELNEIYNIGNGIPQQFRALIQHAKEYINSSSIIHSIPTPTFHKTIQVKNMWLDNSKLTKLGYTLSVTVQEAVEKTISHL